MKNYKPTPELKYSAWKIIELYKDRSTDQVNGLRFNKMMALLDHRLLDEKGLDIKLPRCWYLYGEATVPKQMPSQVKWKGLDNEEEKTAVTWDEGRPSIRSSKNRQKIDSIVDSLYSLFPPGEDVRKAIEEDYESYAPYEFQRLYKMFRYDTKIRSIVDKDGTLRSEAFYSIGIKDAMNVFPYEDFPELKVHARKLELILPNLFKEFPEKNERGVEMAKDFWKIFCRFLRVKQNRYVVDSRLKYWEEKAFEGLRIYEDKLSDDIRRLKSLGLSVNEDPMIDVFLSPDSLGEGFENLSSDVDEIVYG